MFFWSARKIPSALGTIKGLKWDQINSFPLKPLLDAFIHGRVEESLESLQVIALQRAICTSDDPLTHISATANIFGITTVTQMEQLWSDEEFRERFFDQVRNSYSRGLQLRGQDQVNFATAVQRLYCTAAAHCILLLDISWSDLADFRYAVRAVQETSVLVPNSHILNSPACLIRSTLAFSLVQLYRYTPSSETINSFRNHLVICSSGPKHQDWKFLCVLSFFVSHLPHLQDNIYFPLDHFQKAYRGDADHAAVTLGEAFDVLVESDSGDYLDLDQILINMLQYINQMITGDRIDMERKFTLLEICEHVLQGSRVAEAARELIRKIRLDLARVWELECNFRAANKDIPTCLLDMLNHYFKKVRTTYQADLDESVTVLRTFGLATRNLFWYDPWIWAGDEMLCEKRNQCRNKFNEFVTEVDTLSRRNQNRARHVRDPDERWCHRQEQSASIRDLYSLPPDSPDSYWEDDEEV